MANETKRDHPHKFLARIDRGLWVRIERRAARDRLSKNDALHEALELGMAQIEKRERAST